MLIPPLPPVHVFLDGRPVLAYAPAVVVAGRTYAPVMPYLTCIAQSLSYRDHVVLIERDAHRVRIRMAKIDPDALDRVYVPIAPLLRSLGATVRYDARRHIVDVRVSTAVVVRTPAPPGTAMPQVMPRTVFTPAPPRQPLPVWTGPAQPRRTPLPYPVPT